MRFNRTGSIVRTLYVKTYVSYNFTKENDFTLLNGTADLSHIDDPYLKLLLENVRRPNIVTAHGLISTYITLAEYRKGWRKQK